MWISVFVTLVGLSQTQAASRELPNPNQVPVPADVGDSDQSRCKAVKPTVPSGAWSDACEHVECVCQHSPVPWTECYEERITNCTIKGRFFPPNFDRRTVRSSEEAELRPTADHRVYIPSSAVQRSSRAASQDGVMLVASLVSSNFFKGSQQVGKGRRLGPLPTPPTQRKGTVLGQLVLSVRAGNDHISGLTEPIRLTFKYNKTQVGDGTCVFWKVNGRNGYWSTDGCNTSTTGNEFICSSSHLSFFAVLVNPSLSVDKSTSVALSYITYIGSALSVLFTIISLIIYICLQRRRPEKAVAIHMQLSAALLCLHLSFLACSLWVRLNETEEGWPCQALGLFLHWSLLATLSWMALEGFHLYLLLVKVFNIYVRRYLLKLSMVGWGLPTLAAVVCGISGVYGKYSLEVRDGGTNHSSAQVYTHICWMNSQFPQKVLASYITTVALLCLVMLANTCMLGLVVFKVWALKRRCGGRESTSGWKMNKEMRNRLRKDAVTVLGLSWVLGLPWVLASATYISTAGIYAFTILNSLQGVFMFLWSLALTCKVRSDHNSSVRDQSTQKMMTTSFNN